MKLAMGLQRQDGDEATLAKTLRVFGRDKMIEHSSALAASGSYTVRDLKRSLEAQHRRACRARKADARRQKHADRVLYRGLVRLGTQYTEWSGRVVRASDNRQRLAVTTMQDARVVVSRDADGILLPAGSRVLVDYRRGWPEVMVCEVVETVSGQRRLHLWSPAETIEDTDDLPDLGHVA